MDLSRRWDHRHGATAAHPSHARGFTSSPPFPRPPAQLCQSSSSREGGDGRERKRCPAAASAAADDDSSAVKGIKKRPSCSWKRVNLKRDNLADRILELHELVSPFGKKDISSVLQEAKHYIQIQHEQLKALTSAHLWPLPSSALKESGEMVTLTSSGLCLFPVCALPINMLILLQSL